MHDGRDTLLPIPVISALHKIFFYVYSQKRIIHIYFCWHIPDERAAMINDGVQGDALPAKALRPGARHRREALATLLQQLGIDRLLLLEVRNRCNCCRWLLRLLGLLRCDVAWRLVAVFISTV